MASVAADNREQLASRTLKALGQVAVQPAPLIQVLCAPADDPDRVTAAIQTCPALSARLLSVTNSAGVGLSRPIETIRRAVIHLGSSRARVIALAYGLKIVTEGLGLAPEVQHRLWVSSLRKAYTAKLAAQVVDPDHAEHAYSLALLQDVGLPMLMAVDPVFYGHELAPADDASWCELEMRRFGVCHAQVGSRLLQEWNAPSKLSDAVLDHHQPPLRGDSEDALRRLPTFIAGLLPHLDEVLTPRDNEWMIALHAQFLSGSYATPDAFLSAAASDAGNVFRGVAKPVIQLRSTHLGQIASAIAADSEMMVEQLCQLEHNLGKQRETLSHLRFQAFTDPLTKVLNRRGFEHLAQKRLELAAQRNAGVCMVVVDMDDFKPVNDQYGHEAGDLVLRGLAKLMRKSLDRTDLVGRLGGDEFAALMMGMDEAKAQQVVDRLSQACTQSRIRLTPGETVPVRVSIGAAFCKTCHGTSIKDLIAAADEAMYDRKRNGKSGFSFVTYDPWPEE